MPTLSLKAARVNAGLTQKEAAKVLGVSYQTLSLYEDQPDKVRVGTLKKMGELYKVPISYFFNRKILINE